MIALFSLTKNFMSQRQKGATILAMAEDNGLSLAKILGGAKVFCKIVGPAKLFCKKSKSSTGPECLKVQLKSSNSSNESSRVCSFQSAF